MPSKPAKKPDAPGDVPEPDPEYVEVLGAGGKMLVELPSSGHGSGAAASSSSGRPCNPAPLTAYSVEDPSKEGTSKAEAEKVQAMNFAAQRQQRDPVMSFVSKKTFFS